MYIATVHICWSSLLLAQLWWRSLTWWDHRRRFFFFLPRAKDKLPIFPPLSSSLPSAPLHLLSLHSFPLPPFPLEAGALNTARGSGERCKLPQWGLGRSPGRQTIWCRLESKSAAVVAAVFVDFPKNKCNFLHNKEAWYRELGIVRPV